MSLIQDNLYIGSYGDVSREGFLKERKVTAILCCAEEVPLVPCQKLAIGIREDIHIEKIPMDDFCEHTMTREYLLSGVAKVATWLSDGHVVMVHCFGGINRSVSVVLAYLMIYQKMTFDLAYKLISIRRPQLRPSDEFHALLRQIEKECSGGRLSSVLKPSSYQNASPDLPLPDAHV